MPETLFSMNQRSMRSIFGVLFLGLFVGCSSVKLVRDVYPTNTGVGRIESIACGHYAIGNNACWLKKNITVSSIDIRVVTYLSGRLILRSNGGSCSINDSISYDGFSKLKINMEKYIKDTSGQCVIDLIMQPKFPGQEKSDVETAGLTGRIAIIFSDIDPAGMSEIIGPDEDDGFFFPGVALLTNRKILKPLKTEDRIRIDTGDSSRGKVRIDGCGMDPFEFSYDGKSFLIRKSILLRENVTRINNCILYGRIVRLDRKEDAAFIIMNEVSSRYVPLETPVIAVNSNSVRFNSTGPVSWTYVDDVAINSGSGSATVKDPHNFMVRQITAAGRTVVVKYNGSDIKWSR